jgi:hypothetical protein
MAKGDDVYATAYIEDPAMDVDEVEQRELPPHFPAVSVKVEGPTRMQRLPNRQGNVTADVYPQAPAAGAQRTPQPERLLNADPKRARALMVSTTGWFYMDAMNGVQAPIPANVPVVVEHCDAAWAYGNGGTAVITVITEFFADPMP